MSLVSNKSMEDYSQCLQAVGCVRKALQAYNNNVLFRILNKAGTCIIYMYVTFLIIRTLKEEEKMEYPRLKSDHNYPSLCHT